MIYDEPLRTSSYLLIEIWGPRKVRDGAIDASSQVLENHDEGSIEIMRHIKIGNVERLYPEQGFVKRGKWKRGSGGVRRTNEVTERVTRVSVHVPNDSQKFLVRSHR